MPLPAGSRLGPYEILAAIGAGGMGEVYRARDARLNRDVAVKVLPRSFAEDQDRLRRFTLEAQSASALNHPNILVIHDIGTHDGMPYIVSELLEGETLRQRLHGGKLSVSKAVDYARQTASGLAAAHAKAITHRDIKPENIFLTKDGRVKILDFGLAKLTQPEAPAASAAPTEAPTQPEMTEPGLVMGTMGYMSPEQVRGRPADPRSDIFSLGTVLYEMLTGRRAFACGSAGETMSAILKDDPLEAEVEIGPPLDRIIRHCLEKNTDERFQSARDIAFALDAISQSPTRAIAAIEERPAAAAPRAIPWRWVLAGGVLFCALIGALAFFAGARSAQRPPLVFRRLTFRRGEIYSARFAPDGNTLVYSAAWDGDPLEIYSIRLDSPEYHPEVVPGAGLLSVSSAGEMALLLNPRTIAFQTTGTMARVSFSGGAPREVLEKVQWADWSPGGDLAIVRDGEKGNQLEFPVGKTLFRTAGFISQPRFSPAGDRIGFIHHPRQNDDAGEVTVVNLAGQAKTLTRMWGSAWGLAWMPLTDEIWFTAAPGGSKRELMAVTSSGKLRTVLPETGNLTVEDISHSGRVLLHSLSQQMKLRFMGPDGKTQRDLSWLDWSLVTGISNDGSGIVFFESGEGAGENLASYYRKVDGSPAVKLGNVIRPRFSPDGKSAVAIDQRSSGLAIIPIGPGETRRVPLPDLTVSYVEWLPGGRGVVVLGNEAGHGLRLYSMDLGGGKPRPITPEGILSSPAIVSPDGKLVTAISPSGQILLYPVAGGDPAVCPGIEAGERPYGWSVDGATLYVMSRGTLPGKVYRVNWKSGKRELWKEVAPLDAAGVPDISGPQITPDGRSYAYSYRQTLSQLHLVEGLR